ncbi:MAG: carbamoyltransferase HypF, partial [Thermoanaerobaculia bacterium]
TAPPPAARVRTIEWSDIPWRPAPEFTIETSAESAEHRVSIPADLATCDDCVHEIFDPTDRRYRYPFTNCTNCGPRYSIVTGSPYDREKTSMARFTMCEDCRREYEDPLNRRFHAQPNACPKCGPRVVAMTSRRCEVSTFDPINFAGRALRAGLIIAVKGIGGFHLACDATSSTTVLRLRERKRREAKPLAVMVRDLAAAEAIAELSAEESALLTSVERPIVLARLRADSELAPEVSSNDSLVGLLLPYTPLHHLLLRETKGPLVMTSGNVSDEPMVTTNEDAFARLGEIADLFLVHNREIIARADDSIVRVIAGAPTVLRRGRGYVPRAIESAHEFSEPILACGAHLKNAFCIATGSNAFLGPHIGDLETVDTLREYETAIARMKEFIGVEPTVVAHDLHPQYLSTRYALDQIGVRTFGVQHHHAHIVSAMAEHGLEGPVIGVAYDGTGFGTDGTSWGGEILVAGYAGFDRFATFRPIALAGSDHAIRHPWRIALALLDDAFDRKPPLDRIPLFDSIRPVVIDATRRAIAARLNAPLARGVGRYFDAFGAFILGVQDVRYEGELAFRWNLAADDSERGLYPVLIHEQSSPWEIDLRPAVRAAIDDLLAGRSAATISARFHNTIAAATVEIARAALTIHGEVPVVLSGGCFQNARLAESIIDPLRATARVFMNRSVPPGDGGIALGQAFVADAMLRTGSIKQTEDVVCA